MATYSFLRIFRNIDSLEASERNYWLTYIHKREHLKNEYPEGIPMKVLYPEGVFNVREKHGSYHIDESGRLYVSSIELEGCVIPGPDEVPIPWYLLFTGSERYFRRIEEALAALEENRRRVVGLVENLSFNLEKESSTVYFLQQCSGQELDAFAKYLGQEDRQGFVELNYGEVEFLIDPLLAARIEEDKRRLLFPRQITAALELIDVGRRNSANELFEEVCLIHRQIRSAEDAKIELDAPYDPFP
jgi:hypothetical protein